MRQLVILDAKFNGSFYYAQGRINIIENKYQLGFDLLMEAIKAYIIGNPNHISALLKDIRSVIDECKVKKVDLNHSYDRQEWLTWIKTRLEVGKFSYSPLFEEILNLVELSIVELKYVKKSEG
jgi:hypothetical protein